MYHSANPVCSCGTECLDRNPSIGIGGRSECEFARSKTTRCRMLARGARARSLRAVFNKQKATGPRCMMVLCRQCTSWAWTSSAPTPARSLDARHVLLRRDDNVIVGGGRMGRESDGVLEND